MAAAAGGTSVILLPNQSSSTLLAAAKHLRRTLVSIGIDDTLTNIVHVVDKDDVLVALRRADGCVAVCWTSTESCGPIGTALTDVLPTVTRALSRCCCPVAVIVGRAETRHRKRSCWLQWTLPPSCGRRWLTTTLACPTLTGTPCVSLRQGQPRSLVSMTRRPCTVPLQ